MAQQGGRRRVVGMMRRFPLLLCALLAAAAVSSCTMPDGGESRPNSQAGWPAIVPVEDSHPMLQDQREGGLKEILGQG